MMLVALRALLIATSSAAITLAQLNLPKGYWTKQSLALYLATGIFSSVAFYDVARGIQASLQVVEVRGYERSIRAILSEGLLAMKAEFPNADLMDIGVHAFLVKGRWPLQRLVNVGGLRLGAGPSMTRPRWKKGKGVVGVAWELDKFVACDWQEFYDRADQLGRAPWDSRTPTDRYHLSWGELQLCGRYQRISALPIRAPENGRIIGCVAIDSTLPLSDMQSVQCRRILEATAGKVADLGPPPRAWWGNR